MNKIREVLDKFAGASMVKGAGIYPPNDFTVDQAEAAIIAEMERVELAARIDELGHIQLDYGHYQAQTFIDNKAITIPERIDQLAEQRARLAQEGKNEQD